MKYMLGAQQNRHGLTKAAPPTVSANTMKTVTIVSPPFRTLYTKL